LPFNVVLRVLYIVIFTLMNIYDIYIILQRTGKEHHHHKNIWRLSPSTLAPMVFLSSKSSREMYLDLLYFSTCILYTWCHSVFLCTYWVLIVHTFYMIILLWAQNCVLTVFDVVCARLSYRKGRHLREQSRRMQIFETSTDHQV